MALLGCIADDFTGGADLAVNLTQGGFRTVMSIGTPPGAVPSADAVVIALKTRSCPAAEAVSASVAALAWLRGIGCRQFYFKYSSTFESTPRGNIGPVADALLDVLGERFTLACPAFPDNGRTVRAGHLLVDGAPLGESGMRDHPLTPMRDSDLVRLLTAQTRSKVGLVKQAVVTDGAARIEARFRELAGEGVRIAITDAATNADLGAIAAAARTLKLLTGSAALARHLGRNFDLAAEPPPQPAWTAPDGPRAILAGSCSRTTLRQLEHARRRYPSLRLSPVELAGDFEGAVARTVAWAGEARRRSEPVVVYSSGTPAEIAAGQRTLGAERAGEICEAALARIAVALVDSGTNRMILAGGETATAVARALGIGHLRIGPEIDPGVPWTFTRARGREIALALKAGNFGSEHFMTGAWEKLPR